MMVFLFGPGAWEAKMCSVLVGLGQGGLLRCLGLEPNVSTALGTKLHPFAFGLSECALRVWVEKLRIWTAWKPSEP